jgi:ubiquinone/menaquinone biosynthesis C-methylase UbiE
MSSPKSSDPLGTVRQYFDDLGEREWDRLVQSPRSRVSLELHRRLLRRFVRPGWRVLELGAGPGRFTLELAAIGTTIVTSDISTAQLQLNVDKVREAGFEDAIEERLVLDVRDLSALPDESFDATVAYGGPISYAFEQADRALAECVRVTRSGGVVLASVMATIGTMRFFLPVVVDEIRQFGIEVTDAIIRTGDLRHTPADAHRCRMFRWREILAMIDGLPCRLLAASASNATSLANAEAVEWLAAEPTRWQRYLDWEEELAQEPGAIDGGTHILFAIERV